jgi:hypothetical protein
VKTVLLASGQGGGNRVPVRNGLVAEYKFDECRNLAQYSQQMDNAVYTQFEMDVTSNATTAPDGTTTADKALETALNNEHNLTQGFTIYGGKYYTFSVYVKGGLGRDWIALQTNLGTGWFYTFFNITTGAKGALGGDTIVASTIQDVGNGWYRCSVTGRCTSTASRSFSVNTMTGDEAGAGFAGDITKGFYTWGWQVEVLPQSAVNLMGDTQAWNNSSWTKVDTTVTNNYGVAPDGTTTSSRCVSTLGDARVEYLIPVDAGKYYVFSWYAKSHSASAKYAIIYDNTNFATITNVLMTSFTDSWVRYQLTFQAPTGCTSVYLEPYYSYGNGDVEMWGAQLEVVTPALRNRCMGSQELHNWDRWWCNRGTCTLAIDTTVPDPLAPDGTYSASKFLETVDNNSHVVYSTTGGQTATNCIASVYVKPIGRTKGMFGLYGGAWEDLGTIIANFSTVEIEYNTGSAGSIESVGNGWYRISVTSNAPGANWIEFCAYNTSMSYVGDPTKGYYLWGMQCELGTTLTSYEPNPNVKPYEVVPKPNPVPKTYIPTTDKQALMDYSKVEKNLFSPDIATGGDCYASFVGAYGNETVTRVLTGMYQGLGCTKIVTQAGGGGVFPQNSKTSVKPNTTYTMTCYVKCETQYVYITVEKHSNAGIIGYVSGDWSSSGTWARLTVTFTTDATCEYIIPLINADAISTTFYIDAYQLEEGSAATAWEAPPNIGMIGSTLGSDTNDPAWIDAGAYFVTNDYIKTPTIRLTGAHTIIVVANRNNWTGTNVLLSGDSESNKLGFLSAENTFFWRPIDAGDYTTRSVVTGTGYHIAAVVRDAANVCYVWVDNPASIFTAFGGAAQSANVSWRLLGVDSTANANYHNGNIAYLLIYERALSVGEIQKIYKYLKTYLKTDRRIALP